MNNCKQSKLDDSFSYNSPIVMDEETIANKFDGYFVNIGRTMAA